MSVQNVTIIVPNMQYVTFILTPIFFMDADVHNGNRRAIVGCVIASICLGVFVLTFAASSTYLLRLV